jgi:hypothetical protein
MLSVIIMIVMGGYAGCGDCCFKPAPRQVQCTCTNCIAEQAVPITPAPPTKVEIPVEGRLSEIEQVCQLRGGFLILRYESISTLTKYVVYRIRSLDCVEKVK